MSGYEKALKAYQNADFKGVLEHLDSDDTKSLILRVNALCNLGRNDDAYEAGMRLLLLCDDNAQIYLKIASIANDDWDALGLLDKARELILKMSESEQKNVFLEQFFVLGAMRYFFIGERENALKYALSAKQIADKIGLKDEGLYDALGCALVANNRYEDAISVFLSGFESFHTRTFALKLHDAIMRSNAPKELVIVAWALYEQRFAPSETLRAFESAGRDKNMFKNKKVLIAQKQGYGDTIMYLRYLREFEALGADIALSVPKPLKRLLGEHFRLVDESFKPDYEIPFCSLPFYLGSTEIPAPFSFGNFKNSSFKKIGIFWKTTAHNAANQNAFDNGVDKSFELLPLLEILDKKAQIYSFQMDANDNEKALLKRFGVVDLAPNIKDFKDTLNEFSKIDLLITCDTAIAHLAGSAGLKTILLLPNNFDWRWGRFDAPKSPWYPQITCIASKKKNDFSFAFKKLKELLETLEF